MYPSSELDDPQNLLNLLGSYWRDVYPDQGPLLRLLQGAAQLMQQLLLGAQEQARGVRHAASPYRRRLWCSLPLALEQRQAYTPIYGGTALFDGTYAFGRQRGNELHAWALPDGLIDAPIILSHTDDTADQTVWVKNLDYTLDHDRQLLVFQQDPFSALFRTVQRADLQYAVLWLYDSSWDYQDLQRHHGRLADVQAESGSAYAELVRARLDSLAAGPTRLAFLDALTAVTGIPLAQNTETVEAVATDANGLAVITDLQVYRFVSDAVALVAAEDTVHCGDSLTDGLRVWRLGYGDWPDAQTLPQIVISQSLLGPDYAGDLTFLNEDVPTVVTDNSDGRTELRFSLGGDDNDVTLFWETVHARGVSGGQTLAECLDTRTNKVGQPLPSNLPATLNPAKFLAEQVLRSGTVLVQLRLSQLGEAALGLDYWDSLKDILPPWAVLLRLDLDT